MGFFSDFFNPASTASEESESISESFGTSLSSSRPADFTAAQLALQGLAESQGGLQLENLMRAMNLGQSLRAPSILRSLGRNQAAESTRGATQIQGMLDQLLQSEAERIQGGAAATPEQRELIGRIANERIQAGRSDINAALQESLGLLRSELAPSRGFRPEDTPIQDRGQVLAKESLRLTEDLISQARAQEAQQLLEFPLQASALRSQQAQGLQETGLGRGALSLQQQQFQNLLQSEDFARQLGLAQLGPTNVGQFTPPGTISESLSEDRAKGVSVGSATRQGAGPGGSILGSFLGEFLGGIGSLIGNTTSPGSGQTPPPDDGETSDETPRDGITIDEFRRIFGGSGGDDDDGWSIGGFIGDLFGGFGF